ncbi:MAG TPA: S8 family peptidase [Solirubrobacteraceae bacterium]|nr:S8 family peptidase [Solirubrobacteraceae bacterium]
MPPTRPPVRHSARRRVRATAAGLISALGLGLGLPPGALADDAAGVLVRYRPGTTAAERADTRSGAAVVVRAKLPLAGVEVAEPAAGVTVEQAVAALGRDPDVLHAEPNRIRHALLVPNDTLFGAEWGLHNVGQAVARAPATPAPVAGADIHAPAAWDVTTGSPSVVVGVVDTGVQAAHPDLAPNIWTNAAEIAGNGADDDRNGRPDDVHGWDFVGEDNAPDDVTAPGGNPGHGTHVSGTIAARGNDGTGVAGVTWSSSVMPVRALNQAGAGTLGDIVSAYAYAARSGARIVNLSIGSFAPSQIERDVLASLPGTLFVVAAGNDGANTDSGDQATCQAIISAPGFNPRNPPRQCSFPCNYGLGNVVCVAGSDRADRLAGFSNFGTRFVHLAAPGVAIWSAVPGGWAPLSGTSMATPHVAGVAALVLARNPGLSAAQVRAALLGSIDAVPAMAGRVATGGRLNAPAALGLSDVLAGRTAAAQAAPPAAPAEPVPASAVAARGIDRRAPALRVGLTRRAKLRTAVRRGLRASARCSEPCLLSFALVLDARTARRLDLGRTIARATRRLTAPGTRAVVLRLPRALTRVRTARVVLRVRATDAAGNARTRSATVDLRR